MRERNSSALGRRKAVGIRRLREGRQSFEDAPFVLADAMKALLQSMGGTPERAGLQNLWDNWEAAIGDELASLAQPLGHHAARFRENEKGLDGQSPGAVLLIGVEDAMLLQELRFRSEEILARANAFLGNAYFVEVRFSLPLGRRKAPRTRRTDFQPANQAKEAEAAIASGVFLKDMDSASPVARCYARFAKGGKTSA